MVKRFVALLLAVVICLSFFACGKKQEKSMIDDEELVNDWIHQIDANRDTAAFFLFKARFWVAQIIDITEENEGKYCAKGEMLTMTNSGITEFVPYRATFVPSEEGTYECESVIFEPVSNSQYSN